MFETPNGANAGRQPYTTHSIAFSPSSAERRWPSKRALHGRTTLRITALLVTCAGISNSLQLPAHAEYKVEFIPFPQVVFHSNDKDVAELKQQGAYSAVDFFYTAEYQQTLVLAEFYVDNEEKDMERLALGWADGDGNRVWKR